MSRPAPDADFLRRWIGRTETLDDIITPTLADRFRATLGLGGEFGEGGEIAPRLIHFCLCQPAVPTAALGVDGHPVRGDFLPPVDLPRRMWAASDIHFLQDLRVGVAVRRRSRIADVSVKKGRSGWLCFVSVDHGIESGGTLCIRDRQTIVYRDVAHAQAQPRAAALPESTSSAQEAVTVPATLLFRYSALTFNSHRIHYDRPYAVETEGYPGLVVHGPLQATFLLYFAARRRGGALPSRFVFSSHVPLFADEPMHLCMGDETQQAARLWTAGADGGVAMQAKAEWE